MIDFVKKYGYNTYSQNGEDGVIEESLKRIGKIGGKLSDRLTAVEFGAVDGLYCSNTAHLSLTYRGWERILFDIEPGGFGVTKAEITPENVNELIPDCDLLSIDIDGNDYNVWKAYEGKPAIVVIEINSSIPPTEDFPVSDKERGTGYKPMVELGIVKGCFLLCHTGNLIFIDEKYKKLFPEVKGNPITEHEKYFNTQWLHSLPA